MGFFSKPDEPLEPPFASETWIPLGPSQADIRAAIELLAPIAASTTGDPHVIKAASDACCTAIQALGVTIGTVGFKVEASDAP
jgi:hypothetical protein